VLMSINDTFIVLPVLPLLILLGFLLRDNMNLFYLAVILGLFGWPYDARLIRSQVLSLKERSFTRTAVYSGTSGFWITTPVFCGTMSRSNSGPEISRSCKMGYSTSNTP